LITELRITATNQYIKKMDWNEIKDAIDACDTKRLATLLSGRKRPAWDDYHESEGDGSVSSSPPFLHTALSVPGRKGLKMMKILVKAGMDINVLDKDGETVLHEFLERYRSDVEWLKGLLDLGCNPLVQDRQGRTALHVLVQDHSKNDLDDYVDALLSHVDESQRTSYLNAVDLQGNQPSSTHRLITFPFPELNNCLSFTQIRLLGIQPVAPFFKTY